MKKLKKIALSIIILVVVVVLALPMLLTKAGLHPEYDGKEFNFNNKKALIIATNHGVLNKPNETDGAPTGLLLSELSVPYFEFKDANIDVTIASINGGLIPVEPTPWFIETKEDKMFNESAELTSLLTNSQSIEDVDFTEFDIVFLSGGWGAAYDLGFSESLADKMFTAYESGSLIGAICHGVLGLINIKNKDGELLIKNRKMTGVTNKQLQELGIFFTPMHPEDELKKAGVLFESKSKRIEFFANHVVVDDEKRFITGQNQNAGHEISQQIMELLDKWMIKKI